VVPYLPESTALEVMRQTVIDGRMYRILSAHRTHDAWLVALEGIATREEATLLGGREMLALRSELPPLQEDEWYAADLVGLRALRPDGVTLGVVVAVSNFGAGDILVLAVPSGDEPRGATAEERMVPLLEGVLREVRPEEGFVVIVLPEAD